MSKKILYSIYRQKDDHFIHLLNSVRDGSITHSQIDNINDSLIDHIEMDEGKIILTTTCLLYTSPSPRDPH